MGEEPKDPGLAVRYARSTSLSWLRIIIVRGTQIAYFYLIARWLLPDELGYVTALALGITFIGNIVTPWIAWTLQQRALAAKNEEEATKTIHQMMAYGIIASLTVAPLLSALYLFTISVPVLSDHGIIFIIVAVLFSIFHLLRRTYLAHMKIELNIFFGALQTILNLILPLIFFFFTLNITMIFWGWLVADLVVLLLMIPKSGLKREISPYRPAWPTKELVIFTLPVFVLFLFSAFRSFIDRYAVLLFFTAADLASYHLITRITGIAQEAVLTLLMPFLPIMTKVFETRSERAGVALRAALKMLTHALLFGVPLLAFAGLPIVILILDVQYATPENMVVLALASLTLVFFALSALFGNIRAAKLETYKMLAMQLSYVGGFLIFLVIFFLLGWVQVLGIIGIALSMTLGYFVALCFILLLTPERKLIGASSAIRLGMVAIPQTILIYLLSTWFAPVDIIEFIILTGISLLSVLLLSALFGVFANDELEIVSRVSKHRLDPLIRMYQKLSIQRRQKKQK